MKNRLSRIVRCRFVRHPPLEDHQPQILSIAPGFDIEWYRVTYPDVATTGGDPMLHYIAFGAAEGRNPSAVFDTRWYLETYPDVAQNGMNPLAHYLILGAAEGRDPSPFFDARWYSESHPDVARSGMNSLEHYLVFGAAEGRSPSKLFDARWYLETYSDVAECGMKPFDHYLAFGRAEGRHPNPFFHAHRQCDPSPFFDAHWYSESYPDVAQSGMDPLEHYLAFGAAEGRSPSPLFDASWYLETYPDVAESGMKPLEHYFDFGRAEGRNPNPYFHAHWHLENYPEAARGGKDPLLCYMNSDAAQEWDPGPEFSTAGYLINNPDVKDAGINPLLHYLYYGVRENRRIVSVRAYSEQQFLRPSRQAFQEAIDVLEKFSATEAEFARLRSEIETVPVADMPEQGAKGWKRLFLSLKAPPRLLVVVAAIDNPQITRHLDVIGEHVLTSGKPSDLLVVAADEQVASLGLELPHGVEWRSLAEFGIELDEGQRVNILLALIHNLRPMAVLVLDSDIGWRVLSTAGVSISRYCGLFAAFLPRLSNSVSDLEDPFEKRFLRDCLPFLSAVYLSETKRVQRLGNLYGMPTSVISKFQILLENASAADWTSVLAQHPGFLSRKRIPVR